MNPPTPPKGPETVKVIQEPANNLHPLFAEIVEAHGLMPAEPAKTYRGWDISQGRWPEPAWSATGPNYDASWEGEEDGWVDNGEKADGSTYEELIADIDEWFEENGLSGDGA